jgi:hypothetical protein
MTDPQFLLYKGESGQLRVLVPLENETVWLSQAQRAELFHTTKQNTRLHVRNIFVEGELNHCRRWHVIHGQEYQPQVFR